MKKVFSVLVAFLFIMVCSASAKETTLKDINLDNNFESKIASYFQNDTKKVYTTPTNEIEVRNLTNNIVSLLFSRVDTDRVQLLKYIEEPSSVKEIQTLYNTIYDRKESLVSINYTNVYEANNYYISICDIDTSLGHFTLNVLLDKTDKDYKLLNIMYDVKSTLNTYSASVIDLENTGEKSKVLYATDYSNFKIDETNIVTKLANIYTFYSSSSIYFKSYANNNIVSSAKGFLICSGVAVTTWNFLKEALLNKAEIIVSSERNLTYVIDGIVDIDVNNDIVIIKLTNNQTNYTSIYKDITLEDGKTVLSLGSKGSYFNSLTPGILLSHENTLLSYLPIVESEQGSLLFDNEGRIIGMNTSIIKDNFFSVAIPNSYLLDIQNKYKYMDFASIPSTKLDEVEKNYKSYNTTDEANINDINISLYEAYRSVGNIEENIALPLIKVGNYYDYVSFRFKNANSKELSSISYSTTYQNQLAKDGFKVVTKKKDKIIYERKDYRVAIMDILDYLVVIVEGIK